MKWKGSYLFPQGAALILGIILGDLFNFFPLTMILLWIMVFAALSRGIFKKRISPVCLTFFLTMVLGGVLVQWIYPNPHRDSRFPFSQDEKILLTGWVSSPVGHLSNRLVFQLKPESVEGQTDQDLLKGKVRLSVYDPDADIRYGDRLRIRVKLKDPKGFINPDGFDFGRYQRRHGIVAMGSLSKESDWQKIGETGNPLKRKMSDLRGKIREAALSSLSGPDAGIFLAMILGERGGLNAEIRDRFMASGTVHILSISGSHLGFVALVSFGFFRWIWLRLPASWLLRLSPYLIPTQGAALLALVPVSFYALLAGGEVATFRSWVMILIAMVAVLIQRMDHLFNALALAALVILLGDPQALFDISFQLSFLSVLIILFVLEKAPKEDLDIDEGRWAARWRKLKQIGKACMVISLLITLGTAPLVLVYFNQFPWVGVFSNLIVAPFAGAVLVPLGLLSSAWVLLLDPPALPLAVLHDIFLSVFYQIVSFFSKIPFAEIYLPSPPLLLTVFYFLLFFVWIRRANGKVLRWSALGGAGFLVFLWLAMAFYGKSDQGMAVTFLDVGQGDSAVIQFPNGQMMVVDGGGSRGDFDVGRAVVAPYLWNRGVRHIDYVVVSHPQLDHEGGIPFLLEKFSVGEVWTNGLDRDVEFHQVFKNIIFEKEIPLYPVAKGKTLLFGGQASAEVLNPPGVLLASNKPLRGQTNNNRSLVMRIRNQNHSFLFTGDIEQKAQERIASTGTFLGSTVLKVPHHGSKGSLDPEFLSQVCPQVAVISAGGRNPYGHPAPQTLEAYGSLSSRIYRTDDGGAVMVKSDGQTLRITRAVDLRLKTVMLGKGMFRGEIENWRRVIR